MDFGPKRQQCKAEKNLSCLLSRGKNIFDAFAQELFTILLKYLWPLDIVCMHWVCKSWYKLYWTAWCCKKICPILLPAQNLPMLKEYQLSLQRITLSLDLYFTKTHRKFLQECTNLRYLDIVFVNLNQSCSLYFQSLSQLKYLGLQLVSKKQEEYITVPSRLEKLKLCILKEVNGGRFHVTRWNRIYELNFGQHFASSNTNVAHLPSDIQHKCISGRLLTIDVFMDFLTGIIHRPQCSEEKMTF
jgi:hypothetical protein